ncbi:zinc ribbon domain-containing protein [Intrasporangium calvum]|uniref:Zinc ribbon domain-containing protein n=1 Tax=Intrasporangium calvum TaxID=53358 RepID=A0ABT5GDY8_9MICO|nr:zinc ribbon domain-containing protein [Intrasporangium calvum]MDC5696458.1 zinc ribbon domain-containing protein [Intrasporangium calvum]
MTCQLCGAANEPSSKFCSNCGRHLPQAAAAPEAPWVHPPTHPGPKPRRSPRILLGVVLIAILAAAYAIYQGTRPDTHALMVAISDLPSGDSDCTSTSYSAKYIVGTNVTLRLANGEIAGTGTMAGDGTGGANSCTWIVFLSEVVDSAAYTLEINGPAGNETLNYSKSEMESQSWNIALSKNF